MGAGTFPPYLFAYAETLRAEPAVVALRATAKRLNMRLWIVGGTLRDVLLTRWPRDLDLAVAGDATQLAQQVADAGHGTFVPLDPDTGTVRLAINSNQGIDWIDMVTLRADSIEADLADRDFTVNAIGLPLDDTFDDATATYIDPTNGRKDLHRQTLRMTHASVFSDDPLRILRGHRIAAQLGFTIDDATRQTMENHGDLAGRPAAERTGQEFARLWQTPNPADALKGMMDDGLLPVLIPELAPMVGVGQNRHHHLDVWQHTLETVRQTTRLLADPAARPVADFDDFTRADEARRVLLWSALLHDVGKPETRTETDGNVRFHGHHTVGAELADRICGRMRRSNRERQRIARLVKNHLRPLLLAAQGDAITIRAVDRLCQAMGEDLPGLFLLALADCRATRGPDAAPDQEANIVALWHHIVTVRTTRITPVDAHPPLISGHELVHRFNVPQGPRIGHLLGALRDARIDGTVRTRREAEQWLAERLKTPSTPADKE